MIKIHKQNELYHYGVKGMRWGHRKDREYEGRKLRYTSPDREKFKNSIVSGMLYTAASLIPGGSILYNTWAVSSTVNSARHNLDRTDYTSKEGPPEKLSELKKKEFETNVYSDLKKANPRIGQQKGTTRNCLYCTAAMEMRQRGYDVRARKKACGDSEKVYEEWFEGVKIECPKIDRIPRESRKQFVQRSFDNLCSAIEKQGVGARGYVGISYEEMNAGHSMYYTVGDNGVTFFDGQSGKVNPDKLFALADPRSYSYARLDNLRLKEGITNAIISCEK